MNRIEIRKEGQRWVARFAFDYATKDFVKSLGWRFDPAKKVWFTEDPVTAAKLDPNAAVKVAQAVEASRAADAVINVPAPAGLSYFPFQRAGIAYALDRPNVLIGDEMGLGKTVQAIGVINADPSVKSVLVIARAGHKLMWEEHLNKWLVRKLSVGRDNGHFPATDVVITNWEMLVKRRDEIDMRSWDMLIADEVHFAKNPKAQRTQALFGYRDRHNPEASVPGIIARRKIFLTGTPIVNRPAELWTLVESLDPSDLGKSFFGFRKRYCGAFHNGYGWDFTGASNLDELQHKLRSKFMVRRLKKDVLSELPPKTRQVIAVEPPAAIKATIEAERAQYEEHRAKVKAAIEASEAAARKGDKDAYNAAVTDLKRARKIAFEQMSKVRHDTEVAKLPIAIEHITEVLEAEPKVVVLVHHLDVADGIKAAFPNAAVVTGRQSSDQQNAEVRRFQNDPEVRVIVGTYPGALGTGWTLTAARVAVVLALDWVPGNVSQAEDRLHRIGQKDNVLIQHLVFDGSVDAEMARTIIEKQEVIDTALDASSAPVTVASPSPKAATVTTPHNGSGVVPIEEECPF